MNWQERIKEDISIEYASESGMIHVMEEDLLSFLLQEGKKIREEAIEEVKEEVKEKLERVTSLIASSPYYPGGVVWCCKPEIYKVLDKLKSDSEEEK